MKIMICNMKLILREASLCYVKDYFSFRKKTYVCNYFVEHSIRNILDTLQEIETSNPKQRNMRCAKIVIVIPKKSFQICCWKKHESSQF